MVLKSGYLIPSTGVIQFTVTLKISPHSLSKRQSLSITVVSRTTPIKGYKDDIRTPLTTKVVLVLVMKINISEV